MGTKRTLLYILLLVLLTLAAPAQGFAGDEIEISPLGGLGRVSMNARGETLVVWFSEAGIAGRVLAPDDTPQGPELQIAEPGSDYVQSLSASIDLRGFSVVWDQEKRFSYTSWMRRFDEAGEPVTERMDVGQYPIMETDPRGKSVVVSAENGRILGQRFNAAGNPVGAPIVLATPGPIHLPLQVVVDGRGSFVVVWKNRQSELFGRRFDNAGQPRGPAFRIARSVESYDLAGNGQGGFVALWTTVPQGLWSQAFSPSGEASAPVLVASGVAARETFKVSVGMDAAGRFLVTWDNRFRAFGRFFEASGTPLGLPFRVSRPPAADDDFATDATGGPAGQFFVIWLRGPENGTTRLMGRRLTLPARP